MKKCFRIVVLVAIALVLIAVGLNLKKEKTVEKSDKPEIKIGVMFPLSGDVAHMGESAKIAIKMFDNLLQKTDHKYNYKIFLEDNQHNPAKSVAIAKKLIEIDKVDVIATIGSSIGNAVSPVTEQNKVLHFSISTDENVADGDYNFTVATPPGKMVEKILSEFEKRKLKKVALVTQNQSAMLFVSDAFRKANIGRVEITSDSYINNGERDFRILISKILSGDPEIVYAQVYVPEISIFVRQLREAKPDVLVTTTESFLYPENKSVFNGYWYVDGTLETKEYSEEFEKISGHRNVDYSPYLYAILEIIKETVEKTGANKTKIIDYINSGHKFRTALRQISFDERGVMQSEPSLKKIEDGKLVILED